MVISSVRGLDLSAIGFKYANEFFEVSAMHGCESSKRIRNRASLTRDANVFSECIFLLYYSFIAQMYDICAS